MPQPTVVVLPAAMSDPKSKALEQILWTCLHLFLECPVLVKICEFKKERTICNDIFSPPFPSLSLNLRTCAPPSGPSPKARWPGPVTYKRVFGRHKQDLVKPWRPQMTTTCSLTKCNANIICVSNKEQLRLPGTFLTPPAHVDPIVRELDLYLQTLFSSIASLAFHNMTE